MTNFIQNYSFCFKVFLNVKNKQLLLHMIVRHATSIIMISVIIFLYFFGPFFRLGPLRVSQNKNNWLHATCLVLFVGGNVVCVDVAETSNNHFSIGESIFCLQFLKQMNIKHHYPHNHKCLPSVGPQCALNRLI